MYHRGRPFAKFEAQESACGEAAAITDCQLSCEAR